MSATSFAWKYFEKCKVCVLWTIDQMCRRFNKRFAFVISAWQNSKWKPTKACKKHWIHTLSKTRQILAILEMAAYDGFPFNGMAKCAYQSSTEEWRVMVKFGRLVLPEQQLCYAHAVQLAVTDVLYRRWVAACVSHIESKDEEDGIGTESADEEEDIGYQPVRVREEMYSSMELVQKIARYFHKVTVSNDKRQECIRLLVKSCPWSWIAAPAGTIVQTGDQDTSQHRPPDSSSVMVSSPLAWNQWRCESPIVSGTLLSSKRMGFLCSWWRSWISTRLHWAGRWDTLQTRFTEITVSLFANAKYICIGLYQVGHLASAFNPS